MIPAIISGKTTTLDWRIVARDGCSYCVAILTLLWFLTDEVCEKGSCMVDTDVVSPLRKLPLRQ